MTCFAHLTRSQLRRRAKVFTAIWLSWIVVGELLSAAVPRSYEVPFMLIAMVPFVIAGRWGVELWFRAKTAPEVPRAQARRAA